MKELPLNTAVEFDDYETLSKFLYEQLIRYGLGSDFLNSDLLRGAVKGTLDNGRTLWVYRISKRLVVSISNGGHKVLPLSDFLKKSIRIYEEDEEYKKLISEVT